MGLGEGTPNCDRRQGKKDQRQRGTRKGYVAERGGGEVPQPSPVHLDLHTGPPTPAQKSPGCRCGEAGPEVPRGASPPPPRVPSHCCPSKPPPQQLPALSPAFWASITSFCGGSCCPEYTLPAQDSQQGLQPLDPSYSSSIFQLLPALGFRSVVGPQAWAGGKTVMGQRWQSAVWLLCLSVRALPQALFPSPRFWLCQIVLPVRAEPDRLVLGLEPLPAREEEAGAGSSGALLQPSETRSCSLVGGLDSAILCWFEKPEAMMAPEAQPEFHWGPRAQLPLCTMFTLGLGSHTPQHLH